MKYNIFLTAVAGMLLLNSCDIEMVPKGKTTLSTTEELDYLLNSATITNKPFYDISIIVNEAYGDDYSSTIANKIKQGNTLKAAYLAYDESIDRASLSTDDSRYNTIYNQINALNVLIAKVDESTGDNNLKARIKAEATIERAYYHFLIAGIYAAQYDEATASSKGGIAYVKSHTTSDTKVQLRLDEVYENMLADLNDENIEKLPDNANVVRCTKATGYAMKARVLFQMKRYQDALPYALKAIELNGAIENRTSIMDTKVWKLPADAPNNYIYISPQGTSVAMPNYEQLTLETITLFEPGDIVMKYAKNGPYPFWNPVYGKSDTGIDGCLEAVSYAVFVNPWGLTVERIMYLAAECLIRTGEIQRGLDLVNKVRKCRIDPEVYQPFTASNEKEAMDKLQPAKFIECIGSYENYFDRKRWNTEDAYKKTITRTVPDAGTFSISPESPLWVQPFPVEVITYNSTFKQNY
ncbi:MAG: RagB/SusD family nutrient uptake outer membrane protein [Muribaculaceae bacterium]|nr:RagB/SusD family nutrient uptake outer membrane protein [Muribaculaceae bacterium]